MTDTNMTDTNIPHSGGVPQDGGKHMRVIQRNSEQESMGPCLWVCVCAAAVGGGVVSWSAVQCLAQHQCCVGCVGGDSRRVTPGCPFRTRLLSLWALMVLHLGGCGRVGYCQH